MEIERTKDVTKTKREGDRKTKRGGTNAQKK